MISTHPGVLVIRSWPVVDVSLVRPGQEPEWERAYPFHGISAIRREGACWRDDWQEEYVFSLPAAPRPFAIHPTWSFPPLPSPYAFQPGIDYRAGWRKVWHCPECLRDWNDLRDHRPWEYASCPVCGVASASVVLMGDPEARQSELVLVINA